MYAVVGGRSPGIVFSPRSPTVYSVIRSVAVVSDPTDRPSASTTRASLPGGTNTRARRTPSLSRDSLLRASNPPTLRPNDTRVAAASGAIITTLSSTRWPCQSGFTRRCTPSSPLRVKSSTSVSPPFTARSNRPSARVTVRPSSGRPSTRTVTPGSGTSIRVTTRPLTAAPRNSSIAPAATPVWIGSGPVYRNRVAAAGVVTPVVGSGGATPSTAGGTALISTSDGALTVSPFPTCSRSRYRPATVAVNRGSTAVGRSSDTFAPSGTASTDHAYVSGRFRGSLDPAPLNCTCTPRSTVCAAPAFATGGGPTDSTAVISTASGTLSSAPSDTTSSNRYKPSTSGVKPGVAVAGFVSTTLLPAGCDTTCHA